MLVRPASRSYVTWVLDSGRWNAYRPRPGDVVVATYPKSGTTWMQRIVSLLLFQSPDPVDITELSPWYDLRFPADVERVNAALERQQHRRAVKSHLPCDGLPIHSELRYIHVARDGRDACLSLHNYLSGLNGRTLAQLSAIGLADRRIGRPYPPIPGEPARFFHLWLSEAHVHGEVDGYLGFSYFGFQNSWWAARHLPNVLMVHYADLKRDLDIEMRRIAAFLDIDVPETVWPLLVEAAGFETMRTQGDALMPQVTRMLDKGRERFFNRGRNGAGRACSKTTTSPSTTRRPPRPLPRTARPGRPAGGFSA